MKEKELQPESEITEVEVRIDPMIILQCALDAEDDDDDDDDDVQSDLMSDTESQLHREHYSTTENCEKYCKSYLCPLCPTSFISEVALQNHSWTHSASAKRILNLTNWKEAEDEEKETEENDASTNNNDEDNGDEFKNLRYSCPICGKDISTKGNLKVHLETHRPKGKYGCDICGRM